MSSARKVVIVGAGGGGSTFAYALMRSGLASEIALIELDSKRAEGEAKDMDHGLFSVPPVNIHADGKTHHGVEFVLWSRYLPGQRQVGRDASPEEDRSGSTAGWNAQLGRRVDIGSRRASRRGKEGREMASCSEMKNGEVYVCGECGLELQVVSECRDADKDAAECGCHDEGEKEPCSLSCCGRELTLKQE